RRPASRSPKASAWTSPTTIPAARDAVTRTRTPTRPRSGTKNFSQREGSRAGLLPRRRSGPMLDPPLGGARGGAAKRWRSPPPTPPGGGGAEPLLVEGFSGDAKAPRGPLMLRHAREAGRRLAWRRRLAADPDRAVRELASVAEPLALRGLARWRRRAALRATGEREERREDGDPHRSSYRSA